MRLFVDFCPKPHDYIYIYIFFFGRRKRAEKQLSQSIIGQARFAGAARRAPRRLPARLTRRRLHSRTDSTLFHQAAMIGPSIVMGLLARSLAFVLVASWVAYRQSGKFPLPASRPLRQQDHRPATSPTETSQAGLTLHACATAGFGQRNDGLGQPPRGWGQGAFLDGLHSALLDVKVSRRGVPTPEYLQVAYALISIFDSLPGLGPVKTDMISNADKIWRRQQKLPGDTTLQQLCTLELEGPERDDVIYPRGRDGTVRAPPWEIQNLSSNPALLGVHIHARQTSAIATQAGRGAAFPNHAGTLS